MKKTYEKPMLNKGAHLQAVTAVACLSFEPCG